MDATQADARGFVCPMPTIRLGQALRKVEVDQLVELWTDDPGSKHNMVAWSKNTGHELVEKSVSRPHLQVRVRGSR